MRSSSRPLSGAGSAAFCPFWGRRSWPSTARPAAARAESTPPRCTWFRRLRPGRDWCWGNGPRRRSPTRSRPFPNCSRRWPWRVAPSPSTPWAHKPPSPRPFRIAAPTTSWRSRTTSPNWPRRSRTFGAAFAPIPQPTPRTGLPKRWTRTMAASRPAAATCSSNWNASINPGSGKGCAASPCWNRNARSATKPPANGASTSPVWLPTHPASPVPSAPTGPSRTACTGAWMSPSTTTRCAPAPRPQPIIWRCSNTSPSTLSDSTRSNVKAASKPADSSPLPQTYTALNCSDSYDVHAIALPPNPPLEYAGHGLLTGFSFANFYSPEFLEVWMQVEFTARVSGYSESVNCDYSPCLYLWSGTIDGGNTNIAAKILTLSADGDPTYTDLSFTGTIGHGAFSGSFENCTELSPCGSGLDLFTNIHGTWSNGWKSSGLVTVFADSA